MKRTVLSAISLCLVCVMLFALASCTKNVEGTYYAVVDGEKTEDSWIKLNGGEWSDSEGITGTYEVDGSKVIFKISLLGEEGELCTGTVDGDTLTITLLGISTVYKK